MLIQKIKKLLNVLYHPFYRKALFQHFVAASTEHEPFLNNLEKELRCIVDIGANRGQFALAARQHFPRAEIFCFEPLFEPAAVLKKIFKDDVLVTFHEMAVGEKETQSIMHVSKQDDSSSLLPITSLQSTIYPGTEEKETRIVRVEPLDKVISSSEIKKPALLKIDVQGFEGQVLKGCKSLFPVFSYIYVECSFIPLYSSQALAHEVISFLGEKGFFLSGIYNLSYQKGKPVQGDFFFKPKALCYEDSHLRNQLCS